MSGVTVGGALAPFNFTHQAYGYGGYAENDFATFFGTGSMIGANSVDYDGTGAVPSNSPNGTLAILPGASDTLVPGGFSAVYDLAGGDTLTGSGSLDVFLQGGLTSGTAFNTGTGDDKIYAGGQDTITAGIGSNTIVAGAASVTVDGRAGADLYFVGGAGAISVAGGTGDSTLFGGNGSATTFLQGGSGNNTLVGGSGTGASSIGGGNNVVAYAAGSGPTSLFAGTGNSVLVGVTGTGPELFSTNPLGNSGSALIGLNGSSDTVLGGSGASTVLGGTGNDTYAFISGHAGGTETIYGFKAADNILFGEYSNNPIASEKVVGGNDTITLSDNTVITLVGVHKTLF
jgi:Ca2+-binding RTX toxin-like protein